MEEQLPDGGFYFF
jgi:hypothetical protein